MALPVVNDQDHLVGILTFDDAMEVLQESDTEDILRAGASNLWEHLILVLLCLLLPEPAQYGS